MPGDGIGPEIIAEATKVLDRTAAKFGHRIRYTEALVGAAAIDATGNPYPDTTHCICREADAVLFGAIGDPKYDNNPKAKVRPEQGLLRMRKALGLFANLRPVTVYEPLVDRSPLKADVVRGTDFICVRELTSGIYFRTAGTRPARHARLRHLHLHDRRDRTGARVAFRLAGTRRRHLTVVDKANVLETSRMWRETAQRTACEYPDVTVDFMFVDNAAMQIIRRPTDFDVIVTENMFGDILTDEASVISGSLGMLSSASIGAKCALFEPVHGSYPQAAGKDIANPMAAVLSAALLLEHLGLGAEGRAVRKGDRPHPRRGCRHRGPHRPGPAQLPHVGSRGFHRRADMSALPAATGRRIVISESEPAEFPCGTIGRKGFNRFRTPVTDCNQTSGIGIK